jgi:tRNA pseudouridine38-40 synthase
VLEAALRSVTATDVTLAVAGRTDAGVHAWGQVASCEAPDEWAGDQPRLLRALNATLPPDVTVTAADAMPPGFDARREARSRRYCYRLLARPSPSPFERDLALWWPHPVDEGALAACAGALGGRHDFTAFTPTRTDHVRFERDVLGAEWRQNGDVWEFWIEADSFLRHMVRVLVGTMLEVAGGRRNREDFAALLEGAPRAAAGETAPAHGLYLAAVTY